MTPDDLLWTGPRDGGPAVLLAHGAGAAMDSSFMGLIADGLAAAGVTVVRFEFPYMMRRRQEGRPRPPDRMPVLEAAYAEAFALVTDALGGRAPAIGGKSMGGRVASHLADRLEAPGLVCLGYPFHPPGRPAETRIAHLAGLVTPGLILQGERDPFGSPDEVAGYGLPTTLRLAWVPDGDHDLKPRAKSGHTRRDNMAMAVDQVERFLNELFAKANPAH